MWSMKHEEVLSPQVREEIRKGPSEEAKRALMHFMMRTSVPRIAAQRIKRERRPNMKQGKKTTKREKVLIKSHDLNPDEWLIYKKIAKELHLVHRDTKATQIIVNS
ncbi:hypothetical protein ABDI49_30230 [Bacillus cereus]